MQSTPNMRETDPHDVFVIEPDVVLAARTDKAPLDLLYDVLSNSSGPQVRAAPDFSASPAAPPADAAFHVTGTNDIQLGETEIGAHQPATSRFAKRAVMGFFALGSAVAAAAWQHYGDDATAMITNFIPPFTLTSPASTDKPAAATPAIHASLADQTAVQPASSAQPAESAAAAVAPDQSQALQSMARDLAAMGQQINELKASIEQIKASQPQTAREPAKTTEAKFTEPKLAEPKPAEPKAAEPVLVRPRIVPPPPHASATPVIRKPKQVFPYAPIAPAPAAPPPQAAVAPAPVAPPAQTAEDGGPVVRPPMPLH